MAQLTGGCHCRNITVSYETAIAPEDAVPRACQCSFCRMHQTRAVSDPAGSLAIRVKDESRLSRYAFGLGVTEFLICRDCGVYVAAFMADPADATTGFATLMVSALDDHRLFPPPEPAHYDDEDETGRGARRRRVWTPATLTIGG